MAGDRGPVVHAASLRDSASPPATRRRASGPKRMRATRTNRDIHPPSRGARWPVAGGEGSEATENHRITKRTALFSGRRPGRDAGSYRCLCAVKGNPASLRPSKKATSHHLELRSRCSLGLKMEGLGSKAWQAKARVPLPAVGVFRHQVPLRGEVRCGELLHCSAKHRPLTPTLSPEQNLGVHEMHCRGEGASAAASGAARLLYGINPDRSCRISAGDKLERQLKLPLLNGGVPMQVLALAGKQSRRRQRSGHTQKPEFLMQTKLQS